MLAYLLFKRYSILLSRGPEILEPSCARNWRS